jgi:hypothetical protein
VTAVSTTVKIDKAARLLRKYILGDTPAMLWGAPGAGKSEMVYQVAAGLGLTVIDCRLNVKESVDLRGLPRVSGDVAEWVCPADMPFEGTAHPDDCVLFLDEINTASPSVMAAAMQLVLNRKVGEHKLKKGVKIVAAGNRQSDRASANKMPSALANRFGHIRITPDVDAWAAWATVNNVHPALIAFLRFRPALLHLMPGQEIDDNGIKVKLAADANEYPTPRSWTDAAKYADEDAEDRFYLIAGKVGEAAALEFEGFVKTFLEVPSIATILSDPHGAWVPTTPGGNFAVAAALARKITPANFKNALEYASRLQKPYEVLTVVDAKRREPGIAETGAFVGWCGANAGVFA